MQPTREPRSLLKVVLVLLLASFGCILSLVVVGDQICHSNIDQWAPYYPGATVISSEYDFIRLRAIGTSTVILFSPDEPETVRQFYRDLTLELMRADKSRGLAGTSWTVNPNPDGEGSVIILYSECGT